MKLKNTHLTYRINSDIILTLCINRNIFPDKAFFTLSNDNGIINKQEIDSFYFDLDYLCCDIEIPSKNTGLFFFEFSVHEEDSIHTFGEQILIFDDNIYPRSTKTALGDGIVYHIFVDRFFANSIIKTRNDAVYFDDWYNDEPEYAERPGDFLANNSFFGGNLDGITEKLNYIKSLGTSCIYLSPIFEAYSNHKYDAGDFLKVDDGFGGDLALKRLIKAAKKLGINVILDCAFNHTGDDSIYFNRYSKYPSLGAYQLKDSEYYSWYAFNNHPDDYECWWGVDVLPRTVRNKSFRSFICNEVLPKYLRLGIDGVRLDVVDELEDDFIKEITNVVKKYNNDGVIIGEVWEDASNKIAYDIRKQYFYGEQLDGVTNYPLREGIIDFLKSSDKALLSNTINILLSHYPKYNLDNSLNFLGSHDTERIITILGGESGEGKTGSKLVKMRMNDDEYKNAVSLLKKAFLLLLTLPGTPCIYYGDEVGMQGYRDPFNRRTFPWGKEDKELLEFVRNIANYRIDGEFKLLDSSDSCFAFERGKFICAINMNSRAEELNIDGSFYDILTQTIFNDIVTIPPNNAILLYKNKG